MKIPIPRLLLPFFRLSLVSLKDLQLSFFFLLSGLSSQTLHLTTVSSSATSLHIWSPRRRRNNKPSLLLIHGFGGNSKWQFHSQIKNLSRSFDLYIPDLVFFGESVSDTVDRSVGFQSRCVAAAMRVLDVEKYSVAGISYGGFVGFLLAVEEEAAVEKVVILTAGICATAEEISGMAGREKRDVIEILLPQRAEDLMELMRRSLYRPPTWLPEFLLRDFVHVMYKDHRKERVELLLELLSNGLDLHPLPVLSKEVLIIWGDKDNVFPISLGQRLQRHLGRNASLEVIADAGHAVQLEKPHIMMFKDHRKERAELLKALLSDGVGWDPLPPLKQESLILWGDQDAIFPLPLAYSLKRHLGGKARLQVIEKAGHALPLEQSRHVNNLIKRFILAKKVV